MSQYAFCQIISNINNLIAAKNIVDLKGYTLAEWDREGFVGWDKGLGTYFLQLDIGDPIAWWIIDRGAIPTFQTLCSVINKLFNQPEGVFQFNDIIAKD